MIAEVVNEGSRKKSFFVVGTNNDAEPHSGGSTIEHHYRMCPSRTRTVPVTLT